MKRILLSIILITTFIGCKKSPDKLITGRWDFVEAMPVYNDLSSAPITKNAEGKQDKTLTDFSKKSLLSNKLIIRKNGSFDLCLLQCYMHGNWRLDSKLKMLKLTNAADKDSFAIKIDSSNAGFIQLNADSFFIKKVIALSHTDTAHATPLSITSCSFYLFKSYERYSSEKDDPYSMTSNQWRIKPALAENEQQLKQRVLNHLHFLQLIFKDAVDKDRVQVSYNWFNTPLIMAVNGVALNFFDDIQPDWSKNFYDTAQARQGYQQLRKSFKKKINYLKTDNVFEKKIDMFRQMIENVENN